MSLRCQPVKGAAAARRDASLVAEDGEVSPLSFQITKSSVNLNRSCAMAWLKQLANLESIPLLFLGEVNELGQCLFPNLSPSFCPLLPSLLESFVVFFLSG